MGQGTAARLVEAFARETGPGLVQLGAGEVGRVLPLGRARQRRGRGALRSSNSVATNKANPSRCFLDEPAKPPEAQRDFWQALVGGTVRERPSR